MDAILDDTGTAGVALSAAICNKVADHVRRRTQANVEASSDGDTLSLGSEYGFIQQAQESNTTDTAGLLTVKKTDGTTTLSCTININGGRDTGLAAQAFTITAGETGEGIIEGGIVARDFSATFSGSTSDEEPHTLSDATYYIAPRRLVRG